MTRPGQAIATRLPRAVMLLVALMAAMLALAAFTAAPAAADEVDTDEYPYRVSGNVQLDGQPLEGVELTVSGNGIETDVVTDAGGKWAVGVPERNAEYTVSLDETSLPEGIAVVDETDETPNVKEVTVGPGGRVTVNFFIGEGERNVSSAFDRLLILFVNGLNFGLMLGLAAVGLSLVFGTTGLSNFAHAEMVTFGALIAYFLSVVLGLTIWLAIPLAVVTSGLLGWGMDAGLWRPLRRRGIGLVQLMIVSIGLSLVGRYIYQLFIGGGTQQLPGASDIQKFPVIGPISLSWIDIASMGTSIVVIIVFGWWLQRTRIGKATRAVSDNAALAAASGIDVDRVVRIVWIVATALAGLSGVLWAYFRPGLRWDMGMQILLLIFAAVTLGGLGTAFGALIGSIIVGVLVEMSGFWIPTDLRYVGALVILIVILLFRPQGILGRRERIG